MYELPSIEASLEGIPASTGNMSGSTASLWQLRKWLAQEYRSYAKGVIAL